MKIAAFNASPRTAGNTEILLHEMIRPMEFAGQDIAVFNLNVMNIKPCQDCSGCEGTGECVIDDDMRYIYEAIKSADRFILASPIFFFGLSAQAKTMIDRCQSFWCEKYLLKKPLAAGPNGRKAVLLLVGGMKKEIGIQCSEATARAFFRSISVPEDETISFLGVDKKGAICERADAFDEVYRAGRRLIGLDQ